MELKELYYDIKKTINKLDFNKLWPGFKPLNFALYDNKQAFYNEEYINKPDEFCANTSIHYKGEQIAIWMIQEELDIITLTSKIVHEMFHGYQNLMGWKCWPMELEALYKYEYNIDNLSLKLKENEYLLSMIDKCDNNTLKKVLESRKLRKEKYPYEFKYESEVEEIEGSANYVEWMVLEELDKEKANNLILHMKSLMTKPEYLFPIRISCYFTGALMINALRNTNNYLFNTDNRPYIYQVLKNIELPSLKLDNNNLENVTKAINSFNQETKDIINKALDNNIVILEGEYLLLGVNIYNARHYKNYITSTYFLMYQDQKEQKILQGNFIIQMKDEHTIEKVYKWA